MTWIVIQNLNQGHPSNSLLIHIKWICIEIVLNVHIMGFNVNLDHKQFRYYSVDTAIDCDLHKACSHQRLLAQILTRLRRSGTRIRHYIRNQLRFSERLLFFLPCERLALAKIHSVNTPILAVSTPEYLNRF